MELLCNWIELKKIELSLNYPLICALKFFKAYVSMFANIKASFLDKSYYTFDFIRPLPLYFF